MRIIGGRFRGKRLKEHYSNATRPTTDRVKENIFNILSNGKNFEGAHVLDLFAGTGQCGLECYSRGADKIILNDADAAAAEVIRKNSKELGAVVQIINLDYLICLEMLKSHKFDIIFLDPPYADTVVAVSAINFITANGMLAKGGIIVWESENVKDFSFDDFDIRMKKYGRAQIIFLTRTECG